MQFNSKIQEVEHKHTDHILRLTNGKDNEHESLRKACEDIIIDMRAEERAKAESLNNLIIKFKAELRPEVSEKDLNIDEFVEELVTELHRTQVELFGLKNQHFELEKKQNRLRIKRLETIKTIEEQKKQISSLY